MGETEDDTLKYPTGFVLVFSTGEYSDYGLAGFVVTTIASAIRALSAPAGQTGDVG